MNVKHLTVAAAGVLSLIFSVGFAQRTAAQSVYEDYTFTTMAGPDDAGPGWLDGVGSAARFNNPASIARDASGNLYVADAVNNTIRKITPDGSVTTFAGLNGTTGSTDGLGAAARFNSPFGIAVDSNGYIYVSDSGAHIIRKISPSGLVTTFAGLAGISGTNNGTGSAARFNEPDGLAIDSNNNLYVADTVNHVIRKITPDAIVTTLAGSMGNPGSADKTGTAASFRAPIGVAVDSGGNVYVADSGNHTIRKITPGGVVSTLAGLALTPGTNDGTNQTARFNQPWNLTVDGNTNLYVTDTFNHTIREVTPAGVVTTPVGSAGNPGSVDDTGTAARFNFPDGIVVDENTNLYVADLANNSIRKVTAGLVVTTVAGVPTAFGSTDATGNAARFEAPSGAALDSQGNVYVADLANNTIRKITSSGVVSTVAGLAGASGTNDGVGSVARFNQPTGVAVGTNGDIFVADEANNTIREVTPLGSVTTLAGLAGVAGTNDGVGTNAMFNNPFSVAVDTNGDIFVGDTHNHAIRKITPDGTVTTFAGAKGQPGTNNDVGTAARFYFPEGVALDANQNLYVVDDGNFTIRKITPDATVTTFAGIPDVAGSADGPGSSATFSFPFGVAVDTNSGNIFVGDTRNETIRKITPAGVVTTIAGVPGVTGSLDGSGSDALFNAPEGLAVDSQGNVYVADALNHSIRKGYPALPDRPVVDLPSARVGVTRHFSISNQTTTSWSWTVIRRPAGSLAQFSATNIANPTFTPDVEDLYVIQFQGWDNSGHTTIRRLTLVADDTPPSLSITNPISGASLSNGVVTVSGTATDNLGLSNVWVQANGGAWTKAVGNTNWSLDVPLVPGTNIISAYAEDFAGNISATNQVGLTYIVSAPLTLLVKGGGSVTPNLNGVLLEIGQTYSVTAQAGTGSSFVNWTGSGGFVTNSTVLTFVMESNLTFTANFTDTTRPTLAITSPKNGLHVSNAVFTATGTATDNGQLAAVWYQLNGGGWIQASNTSNWTAALALTQANNTLQVYTVDTFNNVSPTNTVSFTYVPSGQMTVTATGQGTVSPNYNGWYLQLGKSFTMTAKPSANWIFAGWTDGAGNALTMSPALKFTVQSNTTFAAKFIPNPFAHYQGPFAGLFYDTNNPALSNSGFFSMSVAFNGSFSAKLQFASGQSASFSGQLSPNDTFSNSIAAKGSTPFIVQFTLDSLNGGRITGSVSQNGWTAQLMAVRASYSSVNAAPQANKTYTLVIPGGNDSTEAPAGNGYGTLSVNVSGDIKFSGVLGDNTKATESTFINTAGQWPLFIAPYKGKGAIFGWMTFTENNPAMDLSGSVNWLVQPGTTLYPAGFSLTNLQAVGSLYSFTSGTPLLNLPAGGVAILQQGNPVQSFTNNFTLGNDNKVTSTNGLSVTITTKSGLFKGTAHDPNTGNPVTINGVLLPKQNSAYGTFIQNGQSGGVYLGQ